MMRDGRLDDVMLAEAVGASLRPRAGWTRDAELVFLVGCPRSGTTWLQSMLASHPALYTGPESDFFSGFAGVERDYLRTRARRVGLSEYMDDEAFYRMIGELFWSLISALPAPASMPRYFLEKSPQHCLNTAFIARTFPRARFIHLVRDGRAVVASLLRISTGWGKGWAPATATAGAEYWRRFTRAGRDIPRIVPPAQCVEVRYEDLRAAPVPRLRALFDWLGVPAGDALVEDIVRANSVEHMRRTSQLFSGIPLGDGNRNARLPLPAYPADFLGPTPAHAGEAALTRLQRVKVERVAGAMLREFGYPLAERSHAPWEIVLASQRARALLRLPPL